MVTLVEGIDVVEVAAEYGATVGRQEYWGCATLVPAPGETPASLAQRLEGDARIITSEPNGYLESPESRQQSFAFDDGLGTEQNYREQDATGAVRLTRAHQIGRGDGVLVAILDTGILDHPLLAGRIAMGRDFVDQDADPTDTPDQFDNDLDGHPDEALGHGTHVGGIVALTAPGARLAVARVLDADGRGDMWSVAAGIYWATARGARVINMSLGSLESSKAVQYALAGAEVAGVVNVASAGNRGSDQPREYPARSSHVLAVAAVDAQDRAAPFTSFGNHVALSAPGVGVRSTYRDGGYAIWSGTSMSAPFVSGTAALLVGLHPEWDQRQVLTRLRSTVRSLDALNPQLAGSLGAGALDAGAALAPDRSAGGGGGGRTPRIMY